MSWYAAAMIGADCDENSFWIASVSGLHTTSGVGYETPFAVHCAWMSLAPFETICARASIDDILTGAGKMEVRLSPG